MKVDNATTQTHRDKELNIVDTTAGCLRERIGRKQGSWRREEHIDGGAFLCPWDIRSCVFSGTCVTHEAETCFILYLTRRVEAGFKALV